MPARKPTKAPPPMAEAEIAIVRIAPETSFKNKAYEALKEAILKMDIYATPEQVMLDERALSERLGVSRTPIREAIAMLEQDGFVDRYVALLNWEQAGYDMVCFVNVSLQMHQPDSVAAFRAAVQAMPEVLEAFHVTGEFDYLLKVAIRNRKDLERFVLHRLTPIPGVARIYTSLALSVVKASTALPLGGDQ